MVQDALKNLFATASAAGIVNHNHIAVLKEQISLKSRVSAACLAVSIKNQYTNLFNSLWAMNENNPQDCIASLLTIGQFGKIVDLSKNNKVIPLVKKFVEHPQGDVRLAASIALGNVTVGNPNAFLD